MKALLLFLAKCLAFVRLMEKRAVSADEKKPDRKSNTINTIIWFIMMPMDLLKTSETRD
jgi:hypothetical protein